MSLPTEIRANAAFETQGIFAARRCLLAFDQAAAQVRRAPRERVARAPTADHALDPVQDQTLAGTPRRRALPQYRRDDRFPYAISPAGPPSRNDVPRHTIREPVRGFVAPTDHGWYQFLRARPEIDEVNFWRPGATAFSALRPGEIFFFKLKAPYNAIGGFGLFARFAPLAVWRAWDIFGQANGTADEHELLNRLGRLSAARTPMSMDRGFTLGSARPSSSFEPVKRTANGFLAPIQPAPRRDPGGPVGSHP